ncbi:hypothetical protein VFPPC_11869 [Pochonia chlamydosporia 170]|uniref:Uncharacterized protein n=1 Tax=Pochonia chlamydosporia 170 TaxID=1380566 RepID=A0A179EZH6_METCM|nr:hypothetical protein VFPPC_11869 [Pochonia chlamydosporia 170]OAQ58243.1 hypothetical protein VFPPC_11869 [Pochonia chlamydosporia 170]
MPKLTVVHKLPGTPNLLPPPSLQQTASQTEDKGRLYKRSGKQIPALEQATSYSEMALLDTNHRSPRNCYYIVQALYGYAELSYCYRWQISSSILEYTNIKTISSRQINPQGPQIPFKHQSGPIHALRAWVGPLPRLPFIPSSTAFGSTSVTTSESYEGSPYAVSGTCCHARQQR